MDTVTYEYPVCEHNPILSWYSGTLCLGTKYKQRFRERSERSDQVAEHGAAY